MGGVTCAASKRQDDGALTGSSSCIYWIHSNRGYRNGSEVDVQDSHHEQQRGEDPRGGAVRSLNEDICSVGLRELRNGQRATVNG